MNLIDVFSRAMSVLRAQPVPAEARESRSQIEIPEVGSAQSVSISIDHTVRNKYRSGWANRMRTLPIVEAVVHATGGGTTPQAMINWMLGGERAKEYNSGIALYHYLIGRDGLIVEIIDDNFYVFHSTSGRHDAQTLAIELINPSKNNDASFTDAQYNSLFKLILDHIFPHHNTITRIVGHKYNILKYSPQVHPKNCPGSFEWDRLSAELQRRGFTFTRDGQAIINIKKS